MKVAHSYYTASKRKGGFKFFEYSEDFSEEELDRWEKIIPYEKPFNMEVPQYPVNFIYKPENREDFFYVSKVKYTGNCNHTPSRPGNFLAHIIKIYDSPLDFIIPEFFEKINFQNSITVEEEEKFEMGNGELQDYFSKELTESRFDKVIERIRDRPYLKNSILNILELLVDGWLNSIGSNITIIGRFEEIYIIIDALYSLQYNKIINKFSFCTYTENPNKIPIKITGTLPVCSGYKSLDKNYFKVVEVNVENYYNYKNLYTKFYKEIFDGVQGYQSLTKLFQCFKDDGISEFGKSLNVSVSISDFLFNVQNKSVDDFEKIYKDCNSQQKLKILKMLKSEKSIIIMEHLKNITNNFFSKNTNNIFARFNEIYKEFFEQDRFFIDNYFYEFYIFFSKKIVESQTVGTDAKINFYITFFNEYCTSEIFNKEIHIINDIVFIDNNTTYIREEEIMKIIDIFKDSINKFISPNIEKKRKIVEINKTIQENGFEEKLSEFKEFLSQDLEALEKYNILYNYIENENLRGKFDVTFKKYNHLIIELRYENLESFWIEFFKSRKHHLKPNSHSINYLKRCFIVNNLNKIDLATFISNSGEYDKYSIEWLKEYFLENTHIPEFNYLNSFFTKNRKIL